MAKFAEFDDLPGNYMFDCPGCESLHSINTNPKVSSCVWTFNGDLDKPTVSPSILVGALGTVPRCHSFIAEGKIQFLADCAHKLAGQTVDLPEVE